MARTILGLLTGLLLTAVAAAVALGAEWAGPRHGWAIALGGGLGGLVAAASAGAQVILLLRSPRSSASYGAFVAGFFAKLLVLVVGILLLGREGSPMDPATFGVAFLCSSALVTLVALSSIVRTFRS